MSKILQKTLEVAGWGNRLTPEKAWREYAPEVPEDKRRAVEVRKVNEFGYKATRIVLRFEEFER